MQSDSLLLDDGNLHQKRFFLYEFKYNWRDKESGISQPMQRVLSLSCRHFHSVNKRRQKSKTYISSMQNETIYMHVILPFACRQHDVPMVTKRFPEAILFFQTRLNQSYKIINFQYISSCQKFIGPRVSNKTFLVQYLEVQQIIYIRLFSLWMFKG